MRRMMNWLREKWNCLIERYWILPVTLVVLGCIVSASIAIAIPIRWLMIAVNEVGNVFSYLSILCLLLMLPAIVYAFLKNKAIGFRTLLTNAIAAVVWLIMVVIAGLLNPDPYAYMHPIPNGLSYEIPIDGMNDCYSEAIESDSDTWLQVSTQYAGLFEYTFYYPNLPEGDIFLRCYEAGTNEPLSADQIEAKTITLNIADTSFCCRVYKQEFTIYEGNAQQYYVARMEVWFRDASTKQETKLAEKYYRVDGYEH